MTDELQQLIVRLKSEPLPNVSAYELDLFLEEIERLQGFERAYQSTNKRGEEAHQFARRAAEKQPQYLGQDVWHIALDEALRLESENRRFEKESESLSVFNTAFGEKLKEFGTDQRFVEEYTALKMEVREWKSENRRLREALAKAQTEVHSFFCGYNNHHTACEVLLDALASREGQEGK